MSLYLLNISVDSADNYRQNIPENLIINNQESIVEIVIEQVLGYENAIKDYDDNDTEEHNKNSNTKLDLIVHYIIDTAVKQSFLELKTPKHSKYNANLINSVLPLDPPPPKV